MSPLTLLTTLRHVPYLPESFPLFEHHITRLLDAWDHFARSRKHRELQQGLEQAIRGHVQLTCQELDKTRDWRIRVLLHFPSAEIQVETYLMPDDSPEFHFSLEPFASATVNDGKPIALDPQQSFLASEEQEDLEWDAADFYRYKTTSRSAYEAAAKRGKTASSDVQIFDTLLHWPATHASKTSSTHNFITELTTSNIAIHSPSSTHHAQWITPRFHAEKPPFLRGVMRTYLLSRDEVREEDISVEQFMRLVREGRKVVGINGLRGVWLANPILLPEHTI